MTMSVERVRVTEETRRHLLDPRLCGLFESGIVRKHDALMTHLYTVDPRIHPRLQHIIRGRIMPTIGAWTHERWLETRMPQQSTFNWVLSLPPPNLGSEWAYGKEEIGGLAYPGGDVMLSHRNEETGQEMPEEIIYSNGLHEAVHALFFAVHSEQGLMCIQPSCLRENLQTRDEFWTTWNWKWRGPLSKTEHAVFAAYGQPMFRNGMTIGEVEDRLEVAETKRPSRGKTITLLFAFIVVGVALVLGASPETRETLEDMLQVLLG